MAKKISSQKAAGLILLLFTAALTFMPNGNFKDFVLSLALCLSLFTASHRGWQNAYGTDPKDVHSRSSSSSAVSSAWSMLISVTAAIGLTIALTMSPGAPKIYVFVGAAPAFYATFNPVIIRIFPKLMSVLCTVLLLVTVFWWPETICGMGLLYISFVSQIVETIVFDRFIVSLFVNLAIIILEVLAISNSATNGTGPPSDFGDIIPNEAHIGFIWKSLKDIAVVGTLFPLLISFDLRKTPRVRTHAGMSGYFIVAFLVFSISLVGTTSGRIFGLTTDLPLCLSTSSPVFVVVLLRALMKRELGSLLMFNAKGARGRSD